MTVTASDLTPQQREGLALIALCKDYPWLSFLCDGESCSRLAAHPWSLDSDSLATNGKALLCVRGLDLGFPEVPQKYAPHMQRLLQGDQTIAPIGRARMDALRAFAAPECLSCMDCGGGEECKKCSGEGYITCETCEREAECRECSGRGHYLRCPQCKKESKEDGRERRECKIGEVIVDRNLLCILPAEYTGTLSLSYSTGAIQDGGRALVISGKSLLHGSMRDWLYLVCEITLPTAILKSEVARWENLPVLPFDAEGGAA